MRLPAERLQAFATRALQALGLPEEQAETTARVLVDTNLRGIDSHGVEKLPLYADILGSGRLNPRAEPRVVDETTTTATLDACGGLGFAPSVLAADMAVEKAAEHGLAAVAVRNSGHFGAASHYALQVADANMVGFVFANTRPLLPAPGGAEAAVGNNPLAFAAPSLDDRPYVFDMACSVAAYSKVRQRARENRGLPAGWGLSAAGQPTEDPAEVLAGGLLAPVGGHKGFGLALMIEILAGVLTGAAVGRSAGAVGEPGTEGVGHLIMAVGIARFGSPDAFRERLHTYLQGIRGGRVAAGASEVRIPGDRSFVIREERRQFGIPLADAVVHQLAELARALDVPAELLAPPTNR